MNFHLKKVGEKLAKTGFEPARAEWHSLGDTELNNQPSDHLDSSILVALCFDKDIFAYNSVTKMKLRKVITESFFVFFFLLYLLVFEFCP